MKIIFKYALIPGLLIPLSFIVVLSKNSMANLNVLVFSIFCLFWLFYFIFSSYLLSKETGSFLKKNL